MKDNNYISNSKSDCPLNRG